ncbi:MAG: hypothetical protein GEU94_02325 [Micromonosporaceae bacterium]|nr:hypothetical protein [Micromonosporaceae bacterium]
MQRDHSGDAGPTTQSAQAGGAASAVQMGGCRAVPVKSWVPDPKNPSRELPGRTIYTSSLVTPPVLAVEPVPGGSRVRVKETSAALAPIEMRFLDQGRHASTSGGRPDFHGQVCPDPYLADGLTRCVPGKFPIVYDVTEPGSALIRRGEEEHCADYIIAFLLTLGSVASEVNRLAQSGKTFASRAAAQKELSKTVKIPPQSWRTYFECLVKRVTAERDDWLKLHTLMKPRPERVRIESDATGAKVALYPVLLPGVGKHSSIELILKALPACNAEVGWKP